jgi:ribosomal protein S18 acetylase RimI-like enzyme
MNHEDIPAVSDLLCACYRWLGERECLAPQDTQFLVKQRGSISTVTRESATETYCVACHDNEIRGMVSVNHNTITKLYVHPRWHRNGFGRLLFDEAEEIIAGNGHTRLVLGTIGESSMPFYKSMGMAIFGRRPSKMGQKSGRDVILLEKAICKDSAQRSRAPKDTASRRP